MHVAGLTAARSGPAGLLGDLQELYQLVSLSDIIWSRVGQAARAVRNRELIRVIDDCSAQTTALPDGLCMSMKITRRRLCSWRPDAGTTGRRTLTAVARLWPMADTQPIFC